MTVQAATAASRTWSLLRARVYPTAAASSAAFGTAAPAGRRVPFQLVDVFAAGTIGSGNPAGVVHLDSIDQCTEYAMQTVATEVNAPATAFVAPATRSSANEAGPNAYDIRWFSSSVELPLCGHATVGAAKGLIGSGSTGEASAAECVLSFQSHLAGSLSVRPR